MSAKARVTLRDPNQSPLMVHSNRELMVKLLAEMRVQTILMAQGFGITDDISLLRDDVMGYGNKTISDL